MLKKEISQVRITKPDHLRRIDHDPTYVGHGTEAVGGVLNRKLLVRGHKLGGGFTQHLQHGRGRGVEQGHSIGHLIRDDILTSLVVILRNKQKFIIVNFRLSYTQ